MRAIACLSGVVLVLGLCAFPSSAAADVFGSGANSFEIEFVKIGSPGNPPDANPNPAGAVPYRYRIGKYEISEQMIDKANALGGLGITKDTRGPDKPATSVTWYEAAQFVNWLNTSNGFTPAYKFVGGNFQLWQPGDPGFNPNNLYRNRRARYFLPSINEWHKAAYYDPVAGVYYDYPTGSDGIPDGIDFVGDSDFDAVFDDGGMNPEPNNIANVGLLSPYGTAGQGGNVFEWEESAFDRLNSEADEHRSIIGGSWATLANVLKAEYTGGGITPTFDGNFVGFRVTSIIPEPSTLVLIGIPLFSLLARPGQKRGQKRGQNYFSRTTNRQKKGQNYF
ncbi:MAG: SUMF1/EgtB/PvdO family nonheme iron enzyme [Pirellulales bacterium]